MLPHFFFLLFFFLFFPRKEKMFVYLLMLFLHSHSRAQLTSIHVLRKIDLTRRGRDVRFSRRLLFFCDVKVDIVIHTDLQLLPWTNEATRCLSCGPVHLIQLSYPNKYNPVDTVTLYIVHVDLDINTFFFLFFLVWFIKK